MKRHPSEELLNDYVDETLSAAERLELERHLAECDDCGDTVEEIRSLVRRAAELPDLPPARDLLPGIRRATHQDRAGFQRWGALAASLIIVGAAAIGTLLLQQRTGQSVARVPAAQTTESSEVTAMAELRAAEEAFAKAAQVLLETLESRRGELPQEALAALEENITLIDESIDEVRRSLNPDGDQVESGRALTALYQQKMQLIWKVSRLSS
jgi:hypothetical protein